MCAWHPVVMIVIVPPPVALPALPVTLLSVEYAIAVLGRKRFVGGSWRELPELGLPKIRLNDTAQAYELVSGHRET